MINYDNIREAIQKFPEQLQFQPEIKNKAGLGSYNAYILSGMGGSNLPYGLIVRLDPAVRIRTHRNYGLPYIPENEKATTLVIAVSHSGNTEETLDTYAAAKAAQIPVAVVAMGGKLLEVARRDAVPHIEIPNTGLQPRMSTGLLFRAVAALMGNDALLTGSAACGPRLAMDRYEQAGRELAEKLKNAEPIIYASEKNAGLAYIWKIKFNETAKTPAFFNVLPELNHNEMTGFDFSETTKQLSQHHSFLLIRDAADHPRIIRRMDVLAQILEKKGFPVHAATLEGSDDFEKMFGSILTADWTALSLAQLYGVEAEQVPLVEEFKKMLG
jgi:glucose/mannose-6-phosphate isomerase